MQSTSADNLNRFPKEFPMLTFSLRPIVCVQLLFLCGVATTNATETNLAGVWVNTDSSSRGVTKLAINTRDDLYVIRAWGACSPSDCDWGTTNLHLLGDSVQDKNHPYGFASWKQSFSQTHCSLELHDQTLAVTAFTIFTDSSRRTNYRSKYLFRRATGGETVIPREDGAKLGQRTQPTSETKLPHIEMDSIYQSLRIKNVRVVGDSFSVGDTVTVAYDLINTSDAELQVPIDNSFSRPLNLVGTRQHWIARKGDDSTIPVLASRFRRDGSQYAAGGTIIPTNRTISAGEALPFQERVSTQGYPSGRYTYYIEYKKVKGETLQTFEVDFELTDQ